MLRTARLRAAAPVVVALALAGCSGTTAALAPSPGASPPASPAPLAVGAVVGVDRPSCDHAGPTRIAVPGGCYVLDGVPVPLTGVQALTAAPGHPADRLLLLDGPAAEAYRRLADAHVGHQLVVLTAGRPVATVDVRGPLTGPVVVPLGAIDDATAAELSAEVGHRR